MSVGVRRNNRDPRRPILAASLGRVAVPENADFRCVLAPHHATPRRTTLQSPSRDERLRDLEALVGLCQDGTIPELVWGVG